MKTVEKLIASSNDKKLGNHRLEISGNIRNFIYYWTTICRVNDSEKTFSIDDSYGTVSTKRACSAYRHQLSMKGYKEVKHAISI